MAEKPQNPQPQQGKSRPTKPARQRYKDQARRTHNRRRNVETDQRRQAKDAALRPRRVMLRKLGALERIDRRIRATSGIKSARHERARLQKIRNVVHDAAMGAAQAVAESREAA